MRSSLSDGGVISLDDLRKLEVAEDEADLAAAREVLSSAEPRVPHREVLAEFGSADGAV